MTIVLIVGIVWGAILGGGAETISNYISCKSEHEFFIGDKQYKCKHTGVVKKTIELKEK